MSWLESFVYGLLSGLAEFLPISAEAHRTLYLHLIGSADSALMRLAVHIGSLAAVLFACAPTLSRLNRERRIAAISPKRRKRQPDIKSLLDLKILRTAAIPVIVLFLVHLLMDKLQQHLLLLVAFLVVNGIILYVPQFLPGANKDSRSMSGLDAFLVGIGAGIGVLPGISRMGASVSAGLIRGAERSYILDTVLVLSIPALIVWILLDCIAVFTASAGISFIITFLCVTAALAALCGASIGIFIMRFLAFKAGFSGFAYYSWGVAFFTFVLYLMI